MLYNPLPPGSSSRFKSDIKGERLMDKLLSRFGLRAHYSAPDPLASVNLGYGFNTFMEKVQAQAVDATNAYPNTASADTSSDIETVTQFQQLVSILDLSVDASASVLSFSGSSQLNYLDSSEYNSYDLFAVAYMKIRMPSKNLPGGDLVGQAKSDAVSLPQQDFYEKYGDTFVSRIDWGGDFFGLLHVHCSSISQKTSMQESLSASGFGLSLDAKIAMYYSAMSQIGHVTTLSLKTGGTATIVDQDNFRNMRLAFAGEV